MSTPTLAADKADIGKIVAAAVEPVMAKHAVPGLSVGITLDGQSHTFHFGVASKDTMRPVSDATIFELGSISKTFTATLAAYAEAKGSLSLSGTVGEYLPALDRTAFGKIELVNLATHTAGGFPLQVPDGIGTMDDLMAYLAAWQPSQAEGTVRTYANPSIGMLGVITARSLGQNFETVMENHLFPALGLTATHISVPEARFADYAQGYTKKGAPARVTEAILSNEAYGVKSTARDMIRFVEANMNAVKLDETLQQAITATHTGYFKAGAMTQDLIWEQYDYPVALEALLDGNSIEMVLNPNPVTRLVPPEMPRDDVWINKTGSTNGFGAYAAFVPQERFGIVLLANKNYPISDRIAAAHRILTELGAAGALGD